MVQSAFDYYRGKASVSLCSMTIHRPDWERTITLKAWTLGQSESLFRITEPPKDKMNGTLKKGREMWIYNPKVNRVIKLPPSMMSQAWMGSDFSNNDLAKSDSLIKDYDHTLLKTLDRQGKKVYVIKSVPKPQAPVIWGMQILHIREDLIFLREEFYDEDHELVKALDFSRIEMVGKKLFPLSMRMQKAGEDNKQSYTQVEYLKLQFKDTLPARIFTVLNLKNPRQ
ncbi:membrane protein [Dethiosulfatarculus sandiegensis]|uniref:Membrane protein n=1 Tax=Dethiosulfatarculus sandiegensis TaxID=1429043 RepID=A0A0D2J658_9BACT|nr:membrane protein [Dethiosulfatarculus sandiegensis]